MSLSGGTGAYQNLFSFLSFPSGVFFPSLLICFVSQSGTESLSSEIHFELLFCSNKTQVLCPRKR